MLTFIMFNYTPGFGHGNNFEPCKQYRAPCAQNKKEKEKRRNLNFGPNVLNSKYGICLDWGSITYLITPPSQIFEVRVILGTVSAI